MAAEVPAIEPPGERLPVPLPDTDGGGGTTLAPRPVPEPADAPLGSVEVLPALTLGGGGTTSVVPKILPIRLLINPVLLDGAGGGGTTAFEGSPRLPDARRCKS